MLLLFIYTWSGVLKKRSTEPPWKQFLIFVLIYPLKHKIPNSKLNESKYAVGSDQNAYSLIPTISIFGQILQTQTLNHLREKEATRTANCLFFDISS
jgi:hypothetical protein